MSSHAETPDPGSQAAHQLLKNKDFLALILCRGFKAIGVHSLTVAVGWHVYQISGDPFDLGLIGLVQFAPAFVLFLVSGYVADRFERRSIMVSCNAVEASTAAAIALLFFYDVVSVGLILTALMFAGVARSFFLTASQALLPNLVPEAHFPRAVAYASSFNKASGLIGPAVGGLLIAWLDTQAYVVILGFFVLAGLAGLLIRKGLRILSPVPLNVETVFAGFNYVWHNKVVLGAISIDLLAVLFGGVMGLLPIFASDILHVGPEGLGLMRAMPGAGALVIGLILTQMTAPRYMGPALFISVAVFGLSIVVFSLSTTFWLSLAALAIYGASDMVSVYIRLTMVQIATPDDMRGRVSAINSISINASNELGDFRAGLMAGMVGAVPAVLVGGMATIGIGALWWRIFPSIRNIDRLEGIAAARS